jgi:RNA polymerase sigma factor (sigma-70 family)
MGAPAAAVVTDGDLIARYQAGDEQAATELVRRHTAALARFLAVQGAPDDDELDDLVQDSFIKAFRGLGSFRGGASFRTWLLAIGANLLKDRRRQWRKRVVVELTPNLPDHSGDPAARRSGGGAPWHAAQERPRAAGRPGARAQGRDQAR